MASKLTQRIDEAIAQGRKALVPYLPFGYPTVEQFWKEIHALDDSGADVIEIGVPFTDPVADGPVIEAAAQDCLANGVTLKQLLEELKEHTLDAGIVLMGYMNPFYTYGFEKLAEDSAAAGVSGFIIPDLPFEEQIEFKAILSKHGLDLVPLVGLNTSPERLRLYAESATGFAYFVSVLGTTGAREALPTEIQTKLEIARKAFDVPMALGFGIKSPEQVEVFGDLIDAVVFGSALVKHVKEHAETDGSASREFISRFK